jgi:squalene-hopene/tetraprenyl-beta-curcumene cyclase
VAPGGWAWTNAPGAIPNADDTAAALTALAGWRRRWPAEHGEQVQRAARTGVDWLVDRENDDGGWPTFACGNGRSPWEQASPDVTANVMRALGQWRNLLGVAPLARRIDDALDKGLHYLERAQQPDGSWTALWFGNELHAEGANPVYGTAKVLAMLHELGWQHTEMAQRGVSWLTKVQLVGGAWGAVGGNASNSSGSDSSIVLESAASVEETALAVDALVPYALANESAGIAVSQGVSWLTEAVFEGRHHEPAPLGFYFARIWYYERLYPLVFATQALASASRAVQGASAVVATAG